MSQQGPRKSRPTDIDEHLKRAFDSLTEEAIPDRLSALLERLRSEEANGGPADGSDQDGSGQDGGAK